MEIATLPRSRPSKWNTSVVVIALTGAALITPMIATGTVSAQEATPIPAACDMEPRPITFIADLLAAPRPDVTPTPVAGVPEGTDVTDPTIRAEVERVVQSLILCVNQGELLRSFSLFDDEYLRRIIDPEGIMGAEVAIELAKSIATPESVAPEDMTTLDTILLVRQQPDGTVTVVFQTRGGPDRDPDETQIDLFVLRKASDRWLIVDGLTDLDPQSLPTPPA
jgi:hypothetical protein